MLPEAFSRRAFLLGTGAVLLAACGGSGNDQQRSETTDAPGSTGMDHDHSEMFVPGVLSSDLYVRSTPQRLAFTVLRNDTGQPSAGKPAKVAIAPPGKRPETFVEGVARFEGLPEFRGVYTTDAVLDTAGSWSGVLEYDGTTSTFAFMVNEEPVAPAPGANAPTVASPTVARPLGVDPICTRDPQCPLHDRSLADLVGKGRPLAVLFATPARCQSAYCGPVLDTLLPITSEYPGIDFVHVDIYENSRSAELAPTVLAWGLPSEPWLYTVDGTGKITGRLDGAFDATEMRALFDALA